MKETRTIKMDQATVYFQKILLGKINCKKD